MEPAAGWPPGEPGASPLRQNQSGYSTKWDALSMRDMFRHSSCVVSFHVLHRGINARAGPMDSGFDGSEAYSLYAGDFFVR